MEKKMAIVITPQSLDTELKKLIHGVHDASIQLPEFQRDWTWDDNRIKGLLASLSQGYPMGAIMRLQYGNPDIKFKYRTFEGVTQLDVVPEFLVLDGQQRLTSMYCSTFSKEPVKTKTDKNKLIERYYYFDINKCLCDNEDRLDAVISVPKDKKIKKNFDRDIELDLSTQELEFKNEMFPVNIIFDSDEREDWADGYKDFYNNSQEVREKYKRFRNEVLNIIAAYKLPVITLDKQTPRDAVCRVFENVNQGGVPLTVFELVTATFAADNFDLRKDWRECQKKIYGENAALRTDIMEDVDESAFLATITLYSTYAKKVKRNGEGATSCKKKDILNLSLQDYKDCRDLVLAGYELTRKFLLNQYVYRRRDIPYATQIIPLAAICAYIGKSKFNDPITQQKLARWYWSGILGEMYGGANETRYANDIEDVIADINNQESLHRTINAASFYSTRLLSLQTRQSAAYKGIMALIYKAQSKDFCKGSVMTAVRSMDEPSDIHHIFPQYYCEKQGIKKDKWNSIVNKTPLLPESNRAIGGYAPSEYLKNIQAKMDVSEDELKERIETNKINYEHLKNDEFDLCFIDRSKKLLQLIEEAMGKIVTDKDSEQVIERFGCSLMY